MDEIHPQSDRLPHYTGEYIPIDRENFIDNKTTDVPHSIYLFYNYLNNHGKFHHADLTYKLSNGLGTKATFLQDRILILHISSASLLEVNFKTGGVYKLAGHGRGPGDISHATSLTKFEQYLYVAGQDSRVSIFDCTKEPCLFNRVINLKQSALAIALDDKERITVLSQIPLVSDKLFYHNENAVMVYNQDGKIDTSFASTYKTDNWLINDMYIQGDIFFDHNLKQYMIYFSHLPYIYIYDQSYNINQAYKILNFEQSRVTYNYHRRSRSVDLNSLIYRVTPVEAKGKYLITILNINDNIDNVGTTFIKRSYDYYYLDLLNENTLFLGSYNIENDFNSDLLIFDGGILINEGGDLKIVEFNYEN